MASSQPIGLHSMGFMSRRYIKAWRFLIRWWRRGSFGYPLGFRSFSFSQFCFLPSCCPKPASLSVSSPRNSCLRVPGSWGFHIPCKHWKRSWRYCDRVKCSQCQFCHFHSCLIIHLFLDLNYFKPDLSLCKLTCHPQFLLSTCHLPNGLLETINDKDNVITPILMSTVNQDLGYSAC